MANYIPMKREVLFVIADELGIPARGSSSSSRE